MTTLNNLLNKAGYSEYRWSEIRKNIINEIKNNIVQTLKYYKNESLSFLRSEIAFNIRLSDITSIEMRNEILKELHRIREKAKEHIENINSMEDSETPFVETEKLRKRCRVKYAEFFIELKNKKKAIERLPCYVFMINKIEKTLKLKENYIDDPLNYEKWISQINVIMTEEFKENNKESYAIVFECLHHIHTENKQKSLFLNLIDQTFFK